eukprot:scaffold126463_cov21-Tisochrysis_lutea.AAC.1
MHPPASHLQAHERGQGDRHREREGRLNLEYPVCSTPRSISESICGKEHRSFRNGGAFIALPHACHGLRGAGLPFRSHHIIHEHRMLATMERLSLCLSPAMDCVEQD